MFFFRHQALARLLSAVGYTHSRNFSLETAYNSLRLHFEIPRLIDIFLGFLLAKTVLNQY